MVTLAKGIVIPDTLTTIFTVLGLTRIPPKGGYGFVEANLLATLRTSRLQVWMFVFDPLASFIDE
jgi:hypothetical protein